MAWGDVVNSGWFGAGAAGVGGLADLYTAINNSQARDQQSDIYKILSDPAKLAAYVQSYNRPMGQAEIGSIRRDLGSQWAPMTGGATGGALNQFIADAMAKIETQRSQTGAGQAIGALQGAMGAIPGQQTMGNLAGVMRALMTLRQLRAPGGDHGGLVTPGGPRNDLTNSYLTDLPSMQYMSGVPAF